ncbi:MAG: hypothetical protein ABSC73_08320 [Acidimicrobiales bacterium]|jgi:hypothetical protein
MARGLMSWLQTAVAEEGKAEARPAADPTGPLVLQVSRTWWPSSFGLRHIRLDSKQILNGAESWLDSCRWSVETRTQIAALVVMNWTFIDKVIDRTVAQLTKRD